MVVVAFYSPVQILRKCSTNHSPPAILLSGDKLAQTSSTLQARLNTQLVAQLAEITSSTTCNKYRFTSEKRPTHWKPQWWDRPSFLTGPPLKSILCTKDCTPDHLLCCRLSIPAWRYLSCLSPSPPPFFVVFDQCCWLLYCCWLPSRALLSLLLSCCMQCYCEALRAQTRRGALEVLFVIINISISIIIIIITIIISNRYFCA